MDQQETEKWTNHYSPFHQILLVGDGDFSFSLSLARSLGSASNIVASSLDPYDVLIKKYRDAKSNLEHLQELGAFLLHGVDATKMKLHADLRMRRFDRIIFNFPHAGFHGREDDVRLIKMHRSLMQGFFRNASGMLRPDGEIHVNHKTTPPFCDWKIEELAYRTSLVLTECVVFRKEDYPGYHNKRGDGSRSDEPFPLRECSTFKFSLYPSLYPGYHNKRGDGSRSDEPFPLRECSTFKFSLYPSLKKMAIRSTSNMVDVTKRGVQQPQSIPVQMHQQLPTSFCYPQKDVSAPSAGDFGGDAAPPREIIRDECSRIFGWYFNHALRTFGQPDNDVGYYARGALRLGFERYIREAPGKLSTGYLVLLEELHRSSVLRSAWLRSMLNDCY